MNDVGDDSSERSEVKLSQRFPQNSLEEEKLGIVKNSSSSLQLLSAISEENEDHQ